MKALLLCMLVTLPVSAIGVRGARAENDPPEVARLKHALEQGKIARSRLVPAGFVKVAEASGDLDGDGLSDVALIVRRPVPKGDGQRDGELGHYDLPQYVVIFRQKRGGRFELWKLGAHHFMHSTATLITDNGVAGFRISKGVLAISSDVAVSMGTWRSGGCTQKWRKGTAGLQLIGLTIADLDRTCACGKIVDVNFSTGHRIVMDDKRSSEDGRTTRRVNRSKVPAAPIDWDDFDFDRLCYPEE